MHEELCGVHTGICTAAAGGINGLAQYGAERLVQKLLHGYRVGLYLPTMITRTVISQFNKVTLGGHAGKGSNCLYGY